ncbi:unnamed protein product [Didymodactylos carnosus]|uniref:Uncharacterized protein n=2 Tax=Didymodactylos carnosus TaxID=1234261 RepID=A0A815N8Y3_9BILA|nr:unnamed protein product [Didymodactylos carnosus]CAF4308192.1 unnamed protein product [Didymodactylos carnosus]
MTSSFLVFPSKPTGNNRRIELAGFDLWTNGRIDNVFVYPSEINIDQFKEALSRTSSLWPLVAGRVRLEDDERYMIEMSDNPITVTLVINNDLNKWPLDSNVIVELNQNPLPAFLDEIQVTKVFDKSQDEPLVRIKLTHLIQSGEWVLGVSWSHVLGDAAAFLHFSNTLSCFYLQMEPRGPLPIFERRLWREDEADQSFLPLMKQQHDSKPTAEIIKAFLDDQITYDPVNLHFSGKQLSKLRILAGGNNVTIQDSLTAYIILTLNTYCYSNNDERRILRTNTAVNYRGVSDEIASKGQVSNAVLMMLSDNFDDPYSLSNIATTIRGSIKKSRDSKFLEAWIATADGLMRKNIKDDKSIDMGIFSNEIVVNSNLRYDWASLVDFGYTDKCRFYTAWTGALYLRIYRLNPEKNGNEWLPRDQDGAEVSFRMEKDLKEKFVDAWKRDIIEHFENVRK